MFKFVVIAALFALAVASPAPEAKAEAKPWLHEPIAPVVGGPTALPGYAAPFIHSRTFVAPPAPLAYSAGVVAPPAHLAFSERAVAPPAHLAFSERFVAPPAHLAFSERVVAPHAPLAFSARHFAPHGHLAYPERFVAPSVYSSGFAHHHASPFVAPHVLA